MACDQHESRRLGPDDVAIGLQPEWSPDGRDLLFVHEGAVRRMPADGSSETVLLDDGLQPDGSRAWQTPAWSPDGSRIVAAFIDGDDAGHFSTELHYTASSAGIRQAAHRVSARTRRGGPMAPLIAFSAQNLDGDPGELHLVQPDGTGEDSIVEPFGLEPDYSPDGTKIVYSGLSRGQLGP